MRKLIKRLEKHHPKYTEVANTTVANGIVLTGCSGRKSLVALEESRRNEFEQT